MAITLMVLAFSLAGDGPRDLLDPRTVENTPGWERHRRRPRRKIKASYMGAPAGAPFDLGPDPVPSVQETR